MLQAWIVFSDIAAASTALRSMQDFPFFDRPLVRPVLPLPLHVACCWPGRALRRRHLTASSAACALQRVSFAKSVSNAVAPKKGSKAAKGKPPRPPAAAANGDAAAAKAKQPADAAGAGSAAAAVDVGTPNAKLFIENLPAATTAAMLDMLFQQFPGVFAPHMRGTVRLVAPAHRTLRRHHRCHSFRCWACKRVQCSRGNYPRQLCC